MNGSVEMMMVQQESRKAISQANLLLSRLDSARDVRDVVLIVRDQASVGAGPYRPIVINDVRSVMQRINQRSEEKAMKLVWDELKVKKAGNESEMKHYIAMTMRLCQGYLPRVCMALQRAMHGDFRAFEGQI